MTGNWISLLLLSFSLSLQLQNGLSQFWKSEIGRLERDGNRQQYYVGEILTLHCYKFSDFVGDVSFAFANTAVSSHNVTVVNSTYARMDKLVTATDFAETNYQCIDGNGLIGSLGPTYIDYRPRNATDLQLVWLNKSSIDLSWGFDGLHYKNAHSQSLVRVTVHWRTSSENSGLDWQVCDESTNTSCSVYRFTDSHASLIVRVSLTIVKRNDTVSTVFSPVSLIAHAKPAAVKSVSVRALNSTAVVLTTSASWQPLNYTISYSTTAQYLKDGGMMVTGLTNQTSWTIGGLHPHYTYRITVRARFEQGYWSDPTSSALLQMPEAAPSSAPAIVRAGYFRDDSRCSATPPAETIYVYYQEVAEECQNGDIVNYSADVGNQSFNQSFGGHTIVLPSLPCQASLDVFLYARNSAGRSPSSLLLVQPPSQDIADIVDKLKFRIRINDAGEPRAEWIPPVSFDDLSLFLYFCNKGSGHMYQCQDPLNYIEVEPEAGHQSLPSATTVMKFGIAVLSQTGRSNGISFTNCLYDPHRDPGQPPGNVETVPQTDHILVKWEARQCDVSKLVIIVSFEIEVCLTLHPTSCHNYLVDGGSTSYKLKQVDRATSYTVRIRANTTSFLTPYSDPQFVQLSSTLESGFPVAGIVGIVLVMFTVFLLAWYCFRLLRNKIKESKKKLGCISSFAGPHGTGVVSALSFISGSSCVSAEGVISAGAVNIAYCGHTQSVTDCAVGCDDIQISPTVGEASKSSSTSDSTQVSPDRHAACSDKSAEDENGLSCVGRETQKVDGNTVSDNCVTEYVGIRHTPLLMNPTFCAVVSHSHSLVVGQDVQRQNINEEVFDGESGQPTDGAHDIPVASASQALFSDYVVCNSVGQDMTLQQTVTTGGCGNRQVCSLGVSDKRCLISPFVIPSAEGLGTSYAESMPVDKSFKLSENSVGLLSSTIRNSKGKLAASVQGVESYVKVFSKDFGAEHKCEFEGNGTEICQHCASQDVLDVEGDGTERCHELVKEDGAEASLSCSPSCHPYVSAALCVSQFTDVHSCVHPGESGQETLVENHGEEKDCESCGKSDHQAASDTSPSTCYIHHSALLPCGKSDHQAASDTSPSTCYIHHSALLPCGKSDHQESSDTSPSTCYIHHSALLPCGKSDHQESSDTSPSTCYIHHSALLPCGKSDHQESSDTSPSTCYIHHSALLPCGKSGHQAASDTSSSPCYIHHSALLPSYPGLVPVAENIEDSKQGVCQNKNHLSQCAEGTRNTGVCGAYLTLPSVSPVVSCANSSSLTSECLPHFSSFNEPSLTDVTPSYVFHSSLIPGSPGTDPESSLGIGNNSSQHKSRIPAVSDSYQPHSSRIPITALAIESSTQHKESAVSIAGCGSYVSNSPTAAVSDLVSPVATQCVNNDSDLVSPVATQCVNNNSDVVSPLATQCVNDDSDVVSPVATQCVNNDSDLVIPVATQCVSNNSDVVSPVATQCVSNNSDVVCPVATQCVNNDSGVVSPVATQCVNNDSDIIHETVSPTECALYVPHPAMAPSIVPTVSTRCLNNNNNDNIHKSVPVTESTCYVSHCAMVPWTTPTVSTQCVNINSNSHRPLAQAISASYLPLSLLTSPSTTTIPSSTLPVDSKSNVQCPLALALSVGYLPHSARHVSTSPVASKSNIQCSLAPALSVGYLPHSARHVSTSPVDSKSNVQCPLAPALSVGYLPRTARHVSTSPVASNSNVQCSLAPALSTGYFPHSTFASLASHVHVSSPVDSNSNSYESIAPALSIGYVSHSAVVPLVLPANGLSTLLNENSPIMHRVIGSDEQNYRFVRLDSGHFSPNLVANDNIKALWQEKE